jgi:hypothetical protein
MRQARRVLLAALALGGCATWDAPLGMDREAAKREAQACDAAARRDAPGRLAEQKTRYEACMRAKGFSDLPND